MSAPVLAASRILRALRRAVASRRPRRQEDSPDVLGARLEALRARLDAHRRQRDFAEVLAARVCWPAMPQQWQVDLLRAALDPPGRPPVVCLCGSTRFGAAFAAATLRETLAGRIVLSVGSTTHSDAQLGLSAQTKASLDELHLRKIEMADEVLILNVGGYVGASTARELDYARRLGKAVRFWEERP